MTTLDQKIYTALTGSTYITDYASSRVYPTIAPQNVSPPHIVYTRISGQRYNGLKGYLTAENPTIQFDVYSTSYDQARTLAGNIHTVLDASSLSAILVTDNDLYEDAVKLYRTSIDYSFINLE